MKLSILALFLSFSLYAHEAKLEDIEVIEHESTQGLVDFVPSVTKIQGHELAKKRQTSIGDTLGTEAGVQSTNFGPSSSRPVIRGLDGDRIRVLQNSLGTLDASSTSVDHAIPVDTLTIDQMEIVRGPMSLLYGSSAVGGVVNLLTNRIHYEYEEGFFSKFLVQGETVNDGLSSAAHLNYGAKNWMFHIDGSTRNLQDQKQYGSKSRLENSFNRQDNVAGAVSRIFDRGYVGVSFNHFNTLYGSVAHDDVKIDMTQNRYELHGEYRPESGAIRKYKVKSAQSEYNHKEIEEHADDHGGGSHEHDHVGTLFENKGNETRLEAHNKSKNWDGVTGLHTQIFEFSAQGEEAFVPSTDNQKISLFTFQQMSVGKNAYRFGARIESSEIDKKSSVDFPGSDEKSYMGYNASIGHCYDFSKNNTLETSFSYTERTPNAQELFADGDHIATNANEQGDEGLKKEKAYAFEVTHKLAVKKWQLTSSVYTQIFKDYINLKNLGTFNGDFVNHAYQQTDALFYGFELDSRYQMAEINKGSIFLINKFDYVRGKDTDADVNLDRISPMRFTAGLEYVSDKWTGDVESMYVFRQSEKGPNETYTDDYILTNIGYTYHIVREASSLDLFVRVRNIFDVEARNHVSFLKEEAPLPGRNLIVGAQFQF